MVAKVAKAAKATKVSQVSVLNVCICLSDDFLLSLSTFIHKYL